MTTQVRIIHVGGNHPIRVTEVPINQQGGYAAILTTLDRIGAEFNAHIYADSQFVLEEVMDATMDDPDPVGSETQAAADDTTTSSD